MFQGFVDFQAIAWGRWGTDGAATAARNLTTARTGAGIYTATLGQGGVDVNECALALEIGTANIIAQAVHTSDTVKTINTFLGSTGAATDSIVGLLVMRAGYASGV